MKKIASILGIGLGVIVLLLLILPFALKGKVADMVKNEGNKMLNGEFDFETLDISLIRNFPSATVSLENFWLKGNGVFENDTLVKAKELSATVDLFSLFGDSGYEVSEIIIDDTKVHAVVTKDGQVNWDIMKATAEEAGTEEETAPFSVKLQQVNIDGLSVVYEDAQADMYAELENIKGDCSGDFGSEKTLLVLDAKVPALTYSMGGVPFLNRVQLAAQMNVDADFNSGLFTLKENSVALNAVEATLDGWVKMREDEAMDMDLKLNTSRAGFKELLSLVPSMYSKDFEGLQTGGSASLSAFAKGTLKGDSVVPQFDMELKVKEALFKYPSLPAGIEKINIVASVKNPGGSLDATTVTVNPFNFVLAGHPFHVSAAVKNPISDLDFTMSAKGKLLLDKIKEVYPLEDMSLNGAVSADLVLSGKLSDIEKEKFERIKAEGSLQLADMKFKQADMPDIDIKRSTFNFSPRFLKLSETRVNIGENDITVDSQFENYLAFFFKGKTLKGNLNINSNRLNLNDFMSDEVATDAAEAENAADSTVVAADSTAAGGLTIPANIDFRMQANLKEVLLDKMKFNDVKGLLIVKDSKVDMSNLSLNTMGGKVTVNGTYATPKNMPASMSGSFALSHIGFAQAYQELDMVKQLAPIFAGLKGDFSGTVKMEADLSEKMEVNLQTLQGSGQLSTRDMSLSGVKFIDQVADIIKKPELKDIKVKNLDLAFTVKDGRVQTSPFDLKLGDCTMNLSGSTGLDQTIDYKGKITLPASSGKVRLSTVDMNIKGTFSSPKVSIDMESLAKDLAGQLLDNLIGGDKEEGTDEGTSKGKNLLDKAKDLFKRKK